MITNATFVQTVPDHSRGQAVGLANAALRVAQGLGIVIAGALTTLLSPGGVITCCDRGSGASGRDSAGLVPLSLARTDSGRRGRDRTSEQFQRLNIAEVDGTSTAREHLSRPPAAAVHQVSSVRMPVTSSPVATAEAR